MSSLTAKVKDLLSSGDSKEEPTQHAPGAFPTEEMEPSETREGYSKGYEQEHNKLHKPNDPRGWTEGDDTARGHGYKDSGVGLTESNDPASYKPSQNPISERRDNPLERRDDTLQRRDDPLERRNDPLERTTGSTAAGGLGDNSNLASRQGADPTATGRLGDKTDLTSREGTDPTATGTGRLGDKTDLTSREGTTGALEPSTQEHPYWGDLPASGGGVHNTVVGHGSPEDEAQRHRAVHSGATQPTRTSAPLESGTFPTTQKRDRDTTSSATNPHDAQRQAQENPREQTSGSRFNEGLAGAGAAGAGALGAHEINKRRTADEPREAEQTTTQPEEHKQRSFPLLGGHKDKDVKEEKHKEEKHKEPKQEKESKLGALFHRLGSKDETDPKAEQEPVKDKHHGSKAAPALAAAGAGGATYAATRDRHGDDTQRDPTASRYQDPSATRGTDQYSGAGLGSTQGQGSHPITGSTQQPYQQDDSHRGAGLATGAAAGLGAGALAGHHGQRSHDDRTGLDANRGYDAQRVQPTGHSSTNPTVQHRQQDDSHRGAGLATGAAAGLGAGALAGHHGQRSDDQTGLDSSRGYDAQRVQPTGYSSTNPTEYSSTNPTAQSHQHDDSHRGAGLATGAAAGLGAGALAGHHGQRSHDDRTDLGRTGLDSNRGYDAQRSLPTEHSSTTPTAQPHHQDDSHRGAGLATGAAAGLGAGALASHYGQRSHDDPAGLDSNRGYDAQRSLPTEHSSTIPTAQSNQEQTPRVHGISEAAVSGYGSGSLPPQSGLQHTSGQPSALGSTQGYDAQRNQPANFSHKDPIGQTQQQHDSHHGAGLAAGTAAGLGAGALASRAGRDHQTEPGQQYSGLDANRGFESQSNQPLDRSLGQSSAQPLDRSFGESTAQPHHQQDSHRGAGLATGTAAGLGAGALASRAGRDHQNEPGQQYSGLDSNRGFESQGNQPLDRSFEQTTAQPHHQQDSHRGAGLATGTAAGLGAGALASHSGRDRQSEAGRSGLDPLNRDESHSSYSTERSARDPTQSYQQEHEGSHRGAGLASGTAAGVGAGALASHELNKRHENEQYPTEQGSRGLQSGTSGTGKYDSLASGTPSGYGGFAGNEQTRQNPNEDKYDHLASGTASGIGGVAGAEQTRQNPNDKYDHLASGTASGIAPSGNQPLTDSHNQSERRSTESSRRRHHTLEENANAGKYNTLASGTPSGVAYDEED
ncbi:hypothetical protein NW762_010574 [Fusarium torreyae]|uniref:Uncharacterized protein n=1 Tax=Fusarium torreyae TaxID=1237075 RepID=A0A9W8RUY7_9HYPO|nr:hypothetical protein NW762_010574 [Fusarium torreyae]